MRTTKTETPACVLGKKPINDSDPLLFPLLNQEIFLQIDSLFTIQNPTQPSHDVFF
jgi:hypothetical protein